MRAPALRIAAMLASSAAVLSVSPAPAGVASARGACALTVRMAGRTGPMLLRRSDLWVGRDHRPPPARRLLRIRPHAPPHVTTLDLDASPWMVSARGRAVWVAAGEFSHEVERISDTLETRTVPVRGVVRALAAGRSGAWAQTSPNQLSKVC